MVALYEPICERCDEDGVESRATEERFGNALCADHADAYDEAAHERNLSEFYGGTGARPIQERYDEAAALKRSQR